VIEVVDQVRDEIPYPGQVISSGRIVGHQVDDGLYPGDLDPDGENAL
jgi:hypothetical protein